MCERGPARNDGWRVAGENAEDAIRGSIFRRGGEGMVKGMMPRGLSLLGRVVFFGYNIQAVYNKVKRGLTNQ